MFILPSAFCAASQPQNRIISDSINSLINEYKNVKAEAFLRKIYIEKINNGTLHTHFGMFVKLKLAEVLERRENDAEAEKLLEELINECSTFEYFDLLAEGHIVLARQEEKLKLNNNCLNNLTIAKNIIDKYAIDSLKARYFVRYSSYHRMFGNKDSALVYAYQAIKYSQKYNLKLYECDGRFLVGILIAKTDPSKAIVEIEFVANYWKKIKNYHGYVYMTLNLIKLNESQAVKPNNTLGYLEEAIQYIENADQTESDINDLLSKLYLEKSTFYIEKLTFDSAFIYLEKSNHFREIALKQSNVTEILKLKQENEKIKLNFEIENQKKLKNLIFFLLLFLISVALLLGFLLRKKYLSNKESIANNQIIEDTNIELVSALKQNKTLLAEVHHRVKNNMQLIISILDLQSQDLNSEKARNLIENISDRIYGISYIHESLYLNNDSNNSGSSHFFINLFYHIKKYASIRNEIDLSYDISDNTFDMDTLVPLGMILSELFSNTFKYGANTLHPIQVYISIEHLKGIEYKLIYRDNGSGFSKDVLSNERKGFGFMIIESMVSQLRGLLSIENENGAITTIYFKEKLASKNEAL
jgi:two-component sensor histidine kinase